MSLRELIQTQIEDDTKRVLPKDLTNGQLLWFVHTLNAGHGRLLQSNRETAMARNFSCYNGVVIGSAFFNSAGESYGPTSMVAGTTQSTPTVVTNIYFPSYQGACSGQPYGTGGLGLTYQWTSYNINAVTISGSNAMDYASLYGAGAGTAEVDVLVTDQYNCTAGAGGNTTVTPKLQLTLGNQHGSIFVGTDTHLSTPNSFFATVLPTGGTFTEASSASGDTFAPVQSGGPGWVVTTKTQSASNGDRKLTVTYTVSGQNPVSQSLNVTARQFAYLTNNSPSNICTLGYGTKRVYTYTPYTHPDKTAVQAGIGVTDTAVTESFNLPPPAGTETGSGVLDANSQFTDTLAYCSTSPLPGSPTVTQTFSIEGYQVRQNTLAYSSTGITYASLGPTQ